MQMQVGADPLLSGTLQLQDLGTFNGNQICLLAFKPLGIRLMPNQTFNNKLQDMMAFIIIIPLAMTFINLE